MKNRKIKKQLIEIYTNKYKVFKDDIWFDGEQLTIYDAPYGYCEGDEVPLWIHCNVVPFTSIKACDYDTQK